MLFLVSSKDDPCLYGETVVAQFLFEMNGDIIISVFFAPF